MPEPLQSLQDTQETRSGHRRPQGGREKRRVICRKRRCSAAARREKAECAG